MKQLTGRIAFTGTDAERLDFIPGGTNRTGVMFYSYDIRKLYFWSGTTWNQFGGGSGGMEMHGNEYHTSNFSTLTLLDVYPVGSIYPSFSPTNPGTLFGGTWVSCGAGRVLVGIDPADPDFNTVEKTGGAKAVASSAQTFAGTPSTVVVNHVHVQKLPSSQTGSQVSGTKDASTTGSMNDALSTNNPTGGVSSYTPAGTNIPGAATSVVQPYLVVYLWRRTA